MNDLNTSLCIILTNALFQLLSHHHHHQKRSRVFSDQSVEHQRISVFGTAEMVQTEFLQVGRQTAVFVVWRSHYQQRSIEPDPRGTALRG